MNILAYIIIALGMIAAWHFIYESILLPSFRQQFRFELYQLRDQLREVKAQFPKQCENASFHVLDNSISWQIDNQHKLTCSLLKQTEVQLKNDAEFREKVEHRVKAVEACQLPDYTAVVAARTELFKKALIFNSLSWVPYVFPLIVAWSMAESVRKTTSVWANMTEKDFDKLTPHAA